MTIVIPCVMHKGSIKPLDTSKLDQWKGAHKQGQHFEMVLSDSENQALTPLALKYFSIRDDYAAVNGYDKEHARRELEYLYGMTYPDNAPPTGRTVTRVDYHGYRWFLSIKEYTPEELGRLVSGSDMALAEASV